MRLILPPKAGQTISRPSPIFFPFLEWLVLERYRTMGGQRAISLARRGVGDPDASALAGLVGGLTLTMTRALGILA